MLMSKDEIFEELTKSSINVRKSETVIKTNQRLENFSREIDKFCDLFFGGTSFKLDQAIKRIRGEGVARDRYAMNRPLSIKPKHENLDPLSFLKKSGFTVVIFFMGQSCELYCMIQICNIA